jgi:hypothetical protein
MARIPAAASASQREMVSFFMLILLEIVGTGAPQSGTRSVNSDEFGINDNRSFCKIVTELKFQYVIEVTEDLARFRFAAPIILDYSRALF